MTDVQQLPPDDGRAHQGVQGEPLPGRLARVGDGRLEDLPLGGW